MQNVDQVHAQDYRQNVTEPQAIEYHTKSTHVYNTGTVSQVQWRSQDTELARAQELQAGEGSV